MAASLGLLHEPETPGLRFDCPDDALDYFNQLVEDIKHWPACHSLNFEERYGDGKIEIVLRLMAGAEGQNLDLIFNAIPPRDRDSEEMARVNDYSLDIVRCRHGHGRKDTVLIRG